MRSFVQGRFRAAAALIIAAFAAPLLFFWADVAWIHPARNYYTVDTEFPYFLNSLAVFKGASYTYIDHPGTPLEMFGTALLALSYPLVAESPDALIQFHLEHPEIFLDVVHSLLILAHIACVIALYLAARRSDRWDDTLEAAAIAAMYFAIHPSSLIASTLWNHNSFAFPLGTLLLLLTRRSLERGRAIGEIPVRELVLLGLGAGVLTAITIFLAAWWIGLVVAVFVFYRFLRRPWSRTVLATSIAGAAGLAGFGISVLPIADKLPVFRNWILSILTHESRYLAVSPDEALSTRLVRNLGAFYDLLPILFIATLLLLVLAAIAAWSWRRRMVSQPAVWALIAGLVVQVIALLAAFLDRPLREAYFLSIAAVLPILTLALLDLTDQRPRLRRALRIALGVLVFAGIASTSAASIATKRQETAMLDATQAEAAAAIREVAQSTGRRLRDVTVLWMYGAYSQCWGLRTGDALADNAFSAEINQICPNQYRIGLNLRFDAHGETYPIWEGDWDLIFTCDQYVRRLVEAHSEVNIESAPSVQWSCGPMNIIRRQ